MTFKRIVLIPFYVAPTIYGLWVGNYLLIAAGAGEIMTIVFTFLVYNRYLKGRGIFEDLEGLREESKEDIVLWFKSHWRAMVGVFLFASILLFPSSLFFGHPQTGWGFAYLVIGVVGLTVLWLSHWSRNRK